MCTCVFAASFAQDISNQAAMMMSGPWADEWILLGREEEEMDEPSLALTRRNP